MLYLVAWKVNIAHSHLDAEMVTTHHSGISLAHKHVGGGQITMNKATIV